MVSTWFVLVRTGGVVFRSLWERKLLGESSDMFSEAKDKAVSAFKKSHASTSRVSVEMSKADFMAKHAMSLSLSERIRRVSVVEAKMLCYIYYIVTLH